MRSSSGLGAFKFWVLGAFKFWVLGAFKFSVRFLKKKTTQSKFGLCEGDMPGRKAGCKREKALTRQQAAIARGVLQAVWCPSDMPLADKLGIINAINAKFDEAQMEQIYSIRKLNDAMRNRRYAEPLDIVDALPAWVLPEAIIDESQLEEYNLPHVDERALEQPPTGRVRKRPSRWIEDPRASANVNGNRCVYTRLAAGRRR